MNALTFNIKQHPGKLHFSQAFPKPQIANNNDVLIEIHFAGVCGTDLHIIDGHFPCKSDGSIILGHEFSGKVIAVGDAVTNVKVNDHVSIDPNKGCMACGDCRYGNVHFCKDGGLNNTIGIFRNGGFAQFTVVPDSQVHKLPGDLTLMQGALSEPISCVIHGWDRIQPVPIGKRILIMGAGIIGNLWLALLQVQGHRRITISEINQARLNHVKTYFEDVVCITPTTLKTQSEAYDLIIDCTGNGQAIEQGMKTLATGGLMCIFGVASPETGIKVSPYELFAKEQTITGVKINPFTFPKAISMLDTLSYHKFLNFEKLGIKLFSLQEFQLAIDQLKQGTIAKAMFDIKL